MMLNRILRSAATAAVVLAMCASAEATPKIGDKAPPVRVAKWISEKPPAVPGEAGAEKHVFLVEFWATWCKPCLKSIPHLAKLHEEKKGDGLVIISLSTEEPARIEPFVKKRNMPYHIASDSEMGTSENYMDDVPGIPHAFLIDRQGFVVWQGNPLDQERMDALIEDVLAGKHDLEKAKLSAQRETKYEETLQELQMAFRTRNEQQIFDLLDKLIALKPDNLQPYLIRREMLREFDRASEIPAWDERIEASLQGSPQAMKQLVGIELSRDLTERNPALMLRCAQRANALAESREPETLSVLARVYCELGMIDRAISKQQEAVALAEGASRESFEKVLAYYERAKALASEQGGTASSAK